MVIDMDVFLLGIASILIITLFQVTDERKRNKLAIVSLNRRIDSLFLELQAAEKAAQMIASYQDECH